VNGAKYPISPNIYYRSGTTSGWAFFFVNNRHFGLDECFIMNLGLGSCFLRKSESWGKFTLWEHLNENSEWIVSFPLCKGHNAIAETGYGPLTIDILPYCHIVVYSSTFWPLYTQPLWMQLPNWFLCANHNGYRTAVFVRICAQFIDDTEQSGATRSTWCSRLKKTIPSYDSTLYYVVHRGIKITQNGTYIELHDATHCKLISSVE
jgi:hypothetical protein